MIDIVIPTIGRPSLAALLSSIDVACGPRPNRVFVVDDRADAAAPLPLGGLSDDLRARVTIVPGRAAGPASARNIGWRRSRAEWIAFLDDDVIVEPSWLEALNADLAGLPLEDAASTGRVRVPLPGGRRPTDWERNVKALETARWITADCAYRRTELLATGGFDERFRRAFREDADLALRVLARGNRIASGNRGVIHPVRRVSWRASIASEAGNADDVLMTALHGRAWRTRAAAPLGALPAHAATVAAAAVAIAAFAVRRPRLGVAAAAGWGALAGRFMAQRIAPGPRTVREILTMAATSVAIPFAAVWYRAVGMAGLRARLADSERAPRPRAAAVLFDRDGTLIVDEPFGTDPDRVRPMPGAVAALERVRAAGLVTAVVSNQSGIALGHLSGHDVDTITARAGALLGPLGPAFYCPHRAEDACACRKPAPGLIEAAARALHVAPRDCVVIGDIGADVEAARAAGARSILVPTPVTRAEEIASAPLCAANLEDAVCAVIGGAA